MGLSGALCLQRELSVGVRHRGRRPCWRAAAEKYCCQVPPLLRLPPHDAALLHTWERLLRERLKRTFSPRTALSAAFTFHSSFFSSVCVGSFCTAALLRCAVSPTLPFKLHRPNRILSSLFFLPFLHATAAHRLFRRREAFLK